MVSMPVYPCNPYNQSRGQHVPKLERMASTKFASPATSPAPKLSNRCTQYSMILHTTLWPPHSRPTTSKTPPKTPVTQGLVCGQDSDSSYGDMPRLQRVLVPKVAPGLGGGKMPGPLPAHSNLKLMAVLSNSCTTFTGQVGGNEDVGDQVSCRSMKTPLWFLSENPLCLQFRDKISNLFERLGKLAMTCHIR